MIYGYARVSTVGQARDGNSLEEQKMKLAENGATQIFTDAYTGTKADRPQLMRLLETVKSGDTVVATKLDRVSRSAKDGIALIDKLAEKGVKVHILNMGMIDNSSMGKLIRTIMFAFAEFERDMIVERTVEGKHIARQREGYREGRPHIAVDVDKLDELKSLHRKGELTVKECCEQLGVSRSSWYNLIK